MLLKKISLLAGLLVVLTAATAGLHWWKRSNRAGTPRSGLPSPSHELQRVVREFRRTADTLASVAGTIQIYDLEGTPVLKQTTTFRYFRRAGGYYMRLSYLQTFYDGEWVVQLDTVNRQIAVGKLAPDAAGSKDQWAAASMGTAGFMGGSLDALFSDTARFRTSGTVTAVGNRRTLRLNSELNPDIRATSLLYDTLDYRLIRAEVEWWKPTTHPDAKGDKAWLARLDYQYPPAPQMDVRKMIAGIVTMREGKATPCAAYEGYQINVNTNGQ